MGYRLAGGAGARRSPEIDGAYAWNGAGAGERFADALCDHQTTGGYPKIAEIAAADVPRLAQLAPGGRCSSRAARWAGGRAAARIAPAHGRGVAFTGLGLSKMKKIDLNCDMGESYGAWKMGADADVMPYISSANIACGFHAGDPATIRKTVKLAVDAGVAIGAHPSLPDLMGFGRRVMKVSPQDMYDLVIYQAGAVEAFARAAGAKLHREMSRCALHMAASMRVVGGDGKGCATGFRLFFMFSKSKTMKSQIPGSCCWRSPPTAATGRWYARTARQAGGMIEKPELRSSRRWDDEGYVTSRAVRGPVAADTCACMATSRRGDVLKAARNLQGKRHLGCGALIVLY